MHDSPIELNWNYLAAMPDEHLPLLEGGLLIAKDEYPDLPIGDYVRQVHEMGERLHRKISSIEGIGDKISLLNSYVFQELGFCGNDENYDDPRNSYLCDVIDRKLGIPISLAVMQMELARCAHLPMAGISFPGHFLVSMPMEGGLLVLDPFNRGRPVGAEELKERASTHFGGQILDDQSFIRILEPASHRTILVRMLRNLKGLYIEQSDWERVARSADRIIKLVGEVPDALRDRGLAYYQIGHTAGAHADLARYLQKMPDADDAESVRGLVIELAGEPKDIN